MMCMAVGERGVLTEMVMGKSALIFLSIVKVVRILWGIIAWDVQEGGEVEWGEACSLRRPRVDLHNRIAWIVDTVIL